ncbi:MULTISPECIES: hypothetical protein [unclassified Caulobacter]|uniref:hypothetical protein n=1 Tax=unclassified Caulobacter TaxID=2648921 RepID=UPI000D4AEB27|nr:MULTISPECIES: hypothetical protein [unclassified Caulobacter]PTS86167.1 hypothetical protein DBR21_14910 [Caulobacter sp. HMWF009]
MTAVRNVVLNPVRVRLAARPQDWPWSSASDRPVGQSDDPLRVAPVLAQVERFSDLVTGASAAR